MTTSTLPPPPQVEPQAGQQAVPQTRAGFLVTGLVGIAVMVLFAHGCHNHDEDLEPSVMPIQVDDPNAR